MLGNNPAELVDFQQTSGVLTIRPEETNDSFSIAIEDDDIVEGDENFEVRITSASIGNEFLQVGADATGVIIDKDEVTFSVSSSSIANPAVEGGSAEFIVSVNEGIIVAEDISFSFNWEVTTDGTGANEDDFVTTSGIGEIAARERETTIAIPIANDEIEEGFESFLFVFLA